MPGAGRRPGRPSTRLDVLRAARVLFAEHGYRGVTVRAVAERAGVDAALVHHYFGTKQGLFRSAMEIPVDPERLIADIAEADPDAAPELLLRSFLRVWDGPETGPAMVGFFRTMLAEPASTESLRDFVDVAVLQRAASGLLADLSADEASVRIALVLSQLLGLVVSRAIVRAEPLASMPNDQLVAAVAPTIERYLRADLSAPTSRAVERRAPAETMRDDPGKVIGRS